MTIWLLTILLLTCVAALGYQQGAIRASISFFGIILAAMLAPLGGKLFKPLLGLFGVVNPVWLWVLPPFFGFILILALVKVGGFFVHQKVDVYYKYKAGDLRLALWERLNDRLGACVGLLNGVAYLILIAMVIQAFSYWTVQMASAGSDPKTVRLLNTLGRDLESTGMSKVAKAVDPMTEEFYDTADLTGLLYQNSLLEARLLRYPGLLSLGEKPEFQTLGNDSAFAEMRLTGASVSDVLEQPSAKAIFANPALLTEIWTTIQPDLKDLGYYLTNGVSQKPAYLDPILGRWRFDIGGSLLAYRRLRPSLAGTEAARMRAWLQERYAKTTIVAAPDKMVAVKNFPELKLIPGQTPASNPRNLRGNWKEDGQDYTFELEGGTERQAAKFEGRQLVLEGEGLAIAFSKED